MDTNAISDAPEDVKVLIQQGERAIVRVNASGYESKDKK